MLSNKSRKHRCTVLKGRDELTSAGDPDCDSVPPTGHLPGVGRHPAADDHEGRAGPQAARKAVGGGGRVVVPHDRIQGLLDLGRVRGYHRLLLED